MAEQRGCICEGGLTLIFPCSGAADVGEISDRAARRLAKTGQGKMYCLAGIGGRVNDILVNTRAATTILAIDGCDADCAKHTLELAGFAEFKHLRLTALGLEKGKAPANGVNINRAVTGATELRK